MKNALLALTAVMLLGTACKNSSPESGASGSKTQSITIDGSSTVYPITEAVAEEFNKKFPNVKVAAGLSGTGGGFKKFGRGEIDINDASRSIQPAEDSLAKAHNIEYLGLLIAYDGLAIVANPQNTWCNDFTVEELKKLWEPAAQGTIKKWNQIRPEWPNEEIHLFGPGVESGTYDYFTEAIVGKSHSSRGDYTASEDDHVLVQGIMNDKLALGFFGLAYYEENMNKLKLIGLDDGKAENGSGAIKPSIETVKNKNYAPLGRPLMIYINSKATERQEVRDFVQFYFEHVETLAKEIGYIPLTTEEINQQRQKWEAFVANIQVK